MKRIAFIIFLFAMCIQAGAQSQAEIAKRIKDIKRSGEYFFFQSCLGTVEEARATAVLSLTNKINRALLESGAHDSRKVSEEQIMQCKRELVQNRNGIYDVFVYVPKSDYIKEAKNNENNTPSQVQKKEVPSKEIKKEIPAKEIKKEPVVQQQQKAQNDEMQPVDSKCMKEWQIELISTILQKENISDVVPFIERCRASRKIKNFGTIAESKDSASSFWVIFDTDSSRSLITVLGPGEDLRMNYKTHTSQNLGDYSGKNAIWFIMAK